MGGGILTPAAGRATQYLPGPRVVDGILPTGRVLLVGGFVLGARHDDFIFCVFFFPPPDRDLRKSAASSMSPPKKTAGKKGQRMRCGEAKKPASGVGGGGRERGREEGRERTKREEGGGDGDVHTGPVVAADAVRPNG